MCPGDGTSRVRKRENSGFSLVITVYLEAISGFRIHYAPIGANRLRCW